MLNAECWLLQAKYVRAYQVFILQVACQKLKPQVDDWFLSVLHILGQELHSLYSKNGGYKLMAALYDYTRGDTS